jgi:hypothetical protein
VQALLVYRVPTFGYAPNGELDGLAVQKCRHLRLALFNCETVACAA